MIVEDDLIFPYRVGGKDCGFLACKDKEFIFKPSKTTAATIPTETLKNNLRTLIKQKKAKVLRAGDVEAVAVPAALFKELFI